ncbi:MAG: hypothetical protein JWO53_278, partial [Chlamydiia bacterium]|nr:hypothetical protein [Chlamydiia bacterium]
EGFLTYVDLDKSQEELEELEKELKSNTERYCAIPKLTFYEVKKLMEGFVNEKVYDIDTKEKLIDIIQSKEARENFLEFIYDHHSELEKWQQYYQERFRVRIIEWLRNNQFEFVFEEDLEMTKSAVEKLKLNTFTPKPSKDVVTSRKILVAKAKTYYSSEALNPRPKRGRPPKQVAKVETEPQFSGDIYLTVPKAVKAFLFTPDYHGSASIFTFSGKFASEADLLAHKRQQIQGVANIEMQNINQKLATLRTLSSHWLIGDTKEIEKIEPILLNGESTPERVVRPVAQKISIDEIVFKEPLSKRELKAEKQLEESFFLKRKGGKDQKLPAGKGEGKKDVAKVVGKASTVKAPFSKAAAPKPSAFKSSSKQVTKSISKKPVAKKAFTAPQSKVRLRPLVKKPLPKVVQKESGVTKKKPSSLRLLRRSKKK